MDLDSVPQRIGDVLKGIAEGIGFLGELTNAEWGRIFSENLWDTGDEEAIKYVMADGAESYRSLFLTRTRQAARNAGDRLVKRGLTGPQAVKQLALQLEFAINPPNSDGPLPLRKAKHWHIAADYASEVKQIKGRLANLAIKKRAMLATMPYPDLTVEELLLGGYVTAADLFGKEVEDKILADLFKELRGKAA